jgi:D-sedoheptulose 7-phosphate isomerase
MIGPGSDWIGQLAALLRDTAATGAGGEILGLEEGFAAAGRILLEARQAGRKALVLGNGGSAAIAAHVQTDLAHSVGLRAMVLHEPSLLTAQANDHGYPRAFANLLGLWADPGDVLVAISSSGRSSNVVDAAGLARERDLAVLTFTGFEPGNPLRRLGHVNFHVASGEYGPVESAHAVLLHQLTDRLLQAVRPGGRP